MWFPTIVDNPDVLAHSGSQQQEERKDPITSDKNNEISSSAATLLARVEAHPLTAPGDPLAFESRLADDNGWTLGHAVRVVREYRRFLVLTQVAGTQVCPSDDVDQAWHLHITRTADYERFCRDVFGHFLHHHPAAPGADEHERHRGLYVGTLAHYRRAFGAEAPADVWPPVDDRFAAGRDDAPASISLRGFDAPGFVLLATLAVIALLAMALALLGVMDASHEMSGPRFLHIAAPVTFALLVLGFVSTGPFVAHRPRDTLDAYEAAWLAGGSPRVVTTAIGMLVDRGGLVLTQATEGQGRRRKLVNRLVVAAERPRGLHPVELACLAGARNGVLEFERAHEATRHAAARIGERLRDAGLAGDGLRIAPARAAVAGLTALWLSVALERIGHALQTPRPVSFLVLLTLVGLAVLFRLTCPARRTWRGHKALSELRLKLAHRHDRRARARRPGDEPLDITLLPVTLALLGPSAVSAQPGFAGLDEAIGKHGMSRAGFGDGSSSGGDGGGGGGCGGGGCGGGCGG